jgi:hypothetical protein
MRHCNIRNLLILDKDAFGPNIAESGTDEPGMDRWLSANAEKP